MNIVLCVVGRLLARICVWIFRVRRYEWCTVRKMLCIHELNMRDNCSVGWRVRDHIHIISLGMLVCLVAVSNSQFSLRLGWRESVSLFVGCECLFNDDQYYHKKIAVMVVVIVAVSCCWCWCLAVFCLIFHALWLRLRLHLCLRECLFVDLLSRIQTMEFTVTHKQKSNVSTAHNHALSTMSVELFTFSSTFQNSISFKAMKFVELSVYVYNWLADLVDVNTNHFIQKSLFSFCWKWKGFLLSKCFVFSDDKKLCFFCCRFYFGSLCMGYYWNASSSTLVFAAAVEWVWV